MRSSLAAKFSSGSESTRTRTSLPARDAAAVGLFDLDVHLEGVEVGHFGEIHAGVDVVADFEGPHVVPALAVVGGVRRECR